MRPPADLAIVSGGIEQDPTRALPGEPPLLTGELPGEPMPPIYMDTRPWYPGRPVTAEMTDEHGNVLDRPDNYHVIHRVKPGTSAND
jgi:hypothetical protein